MNNSILRLTWKTLGHEHMNLDAMNNLGLWMTSTTMGLKLKALDGWHE